MNSFTLINNLKSLLGSNLTDPISSSRVGSYIFGPDQELNYTRYMPKVQIGFSSLETPKDTRSFGQSFERDKALTLWISFYNKRGDTYTVSGNNYINRDYTLYFTEQIEDAIIDNCQAFALHGIDIGNIEDVPYNADKQVYRGIVPVTFNWRKQ